MHVVVEGLPNLLHELVHVLLARCLDDDHGIDYGAIPFDLRSVAGRRVLWEELSCCVVSCAYLLERSAASAGESSHEIAPCHGWERVDAWFVEQVEIQPVFYGMQDDLPGFWREVDRLARVHRTEFDAVLDEAYDGVERALRWAGVADDVARAPLRLTWGAMVERTGERAPDRAPEQRGRGR